MRTVTVCDHDSLGACGGECYRCRLHILDQRYQLLLEAAADLRHAQRQYARTGSDTALEAVRRAEKHLDEVLEVISRPVLPL